RDLFFPRVGQENHTSGAPCRFGVWAEGAFAWLDSPECERELDYENETLITQVRVECPRLQLRLRCADVVDFNRNIYLKRVEVENLADREREVRLFFHFDCHLWGINIGDTAFYHPVARALVHYKGQRYFWLCGEADGEVGLAQYAA